jgi:hypothetical protein
LKFILPFTNFHNIGIVEKPKKYSNKFPFLFFSGVFATVGLVVAMARFGYEVMPRNSLSDCKKQFVNTEKETIGFEFCECIHSIGNPLAQCLEAFETAKKELGK